MYTDWGDGPITVWVLGFVLLLFLIRELWSWHNKSDRILELLNEINAKLGPGAQDSSGENDPVPPGIMLVKLQNRLDDRLDFCYHCGAPVGENDRSCPSCKKPL